MEITNKIYLMMTYSEAYCKKHRLSNKKFLIENEKKGILDAILAMSHELDYLPVEEGLEELEEYISEVQANK